MKNKIKGIEEKLKSKLMTRKQAYKEVFNTPEGKIVLADLYKFARMTGLSHVTGSSHETAFNEGMKRVCYRIKGILAQDDKDVDDLIKAHASSNLYDPLNR